MKKARSFILYLLSTFLSRGTSAILGLVYAIKLNAADLGAYAVIVSLASFVGTLVDAGLSQAVIRGYYDRHDTKENVRDFVWGAVFFSRQMTVGLSIVAFIVCYFVWDMVSDNQISFFPLVLIAFAIGILDKACLMFETLFRALEKPGLFSASRIAQSAITILAGIILVFPCNFGLLGAVGALLAGRICAVVFQTGALTKVIGPAGRRLSKADRKELLAYGIPLMPRQLTDYGTQVALRTILLNVLSLASVGAFFVATSVGSILVTLTTAIDMVFGPWYFKRRVQAGMTEQTSGIINFIFGFIVIGYCALILIMPTVMPASFAAKYAGINAVLPIVMAAYFFKAQQPFILKQLLFSKQTGIVSLVTVTPTIVMILLSPFAARAFGIAGPSWLLLAANIATIIWAQLYIIRKETVDFSLGAAAGMGGMLLACTGIVILREAIPFELEVRVAALALVTVLSAVLWIYPNRKALRILISK